MNKDHTVGLIIGLLAGAIAGGAIALLYAPNTGKETRHLIKDKATEAVDVLKEETSEVMEKIKDVASEANRKGKAAVYAVKN